MNICIIPARGGSKRLPRKNLLEFGGVPLVKLAILTAVNSGCFDQVILSSEDSEILQIGTSVPGASVSQRPPELSKDEVRADEVIRWEIRRLSLLPTDLVCCLLPTTPLLTPEVLRKAYDQVGGNGVLFGVAQTTETPFRSFEFNSETGALSSLFPEMLNKQSHDYPRTVVDAGQFYFASAISWAENFSITAAKDSTGFLLESDLAVDINYPADWDRITRN